MTSKGMPGYVAYSGSIEDDVQHHVTTQEERDLLVHALKFYYANVKELDDKAKLLLDVSGVPTFDAEKMKIIRLVNQYGGKL